MDIEGRKDAAAPLRCEFSTAQHVPESDRLLTTNGYNYRVTRLEPGEGRVYRAGN